MVGRVATSSISSHMVGRMASTSCESCGADVTDAAPVLRKYVTPGAWDQEPGERVLDEVELWCFACRTQYPHEPV